MFLLPLLSSAVSDTLRSVAATRSWFLPWVRSKTWQLLLPIFLLPLLATALADVPPVGRALLSPLFPPVGRALLSPLFPPVGRALLLPMAPKPATPKPATPSQRIPAPVNDFETG